MLSRLCVRNYILIDSLEVDFPGGLIIITGQTGAGKSILLGALGLVLGAKADASAIAASADNCIVEAEFESADAGLRSILGENDLDWDGGHIVLRRMVSRTGRSRAFVNDVPVSLPVLSGLASRLVDIHSQHQTLLLSDRQFQMELLDSFAGNSGLLADCRAAWDSLRSAKSELAALDESIAEIERDREWNEKNHSLLVDAALVEGELESLEEEQKQLANAEQIKEMLCRCESLADPGDDGLPLLNAIKEIRRSLDKLSAFIPSTSRLAERTESSRLELEDIFAEISSINEKFDISPARLEQVDARLSEIYSLFQRFSCHSVTELILLREKFGKALGDASSLADRREELARKLASAERRHGEICNALREARLKASPLLAAKITESLRFLELPLAVFDVALDAAAPGADGADSPRFLFSADSHKPSDVAKCASGGELSRLMLCLKNILAGVREMPTMIFDEIDSGVSGSVADKMGTMICSMGDNMQVFAITHLPQVAAKGSAHYLVSKSTDVFGTVSKIERLSAEQRVGEIARMLSGSTLTAEAIANAKSLLGD